MAGYVLYNGFFNKEPSPSAKAFLQAGERMGMPLIPVANTEVFARLSDSVSAAGVLFQKGDFALALDKDTRLAFALEACGVKLYNSAAAVAVCDDKSATHLALAAAGIPQPDTFVAPMTYCDFDAAGDLFLKTAAEALGYPLVVKECYGSLGGQVYLARDEAALSDLAKKMGSKPFLLQKFVRAAAGTDVRLYLVGGEIVASMKRENTQDFRANIAAGGHGMPYTPTAREAALALRCMEILKLDYAGVDLLSDADGTPLVCEVNSCAFTAEISAVCAVDVPAKILAYVKKDLTNRKIGLY